MVGKCLENSWKQRNVCAPFQRKANNIQDENRDSGTEVLAAISILHDSEFEDMKELQFLDRIK